METPKNDVLQFHCDTLQFLRKQYDLEDTRRINESIDILEEWLKKQQHFVIKELPRDFLERAIILGKGSLQKVKKKLDRLFTYKTLLPKYFQLFDVNVCRNSNVIDSLLPKLTPDHYRVYYLKIVGGKVDDMINFYRWCIAIYEYIHAYDYCNGVVAVFDYTEADPLELLKSLDVIDVQHVIRILVEGFGVRLKGIHIVSKSKVINVAIAFFKQAAGAKIGQRIFPHKDFDTLYDTIPREILPSDCGGNEKPIKELHDNFVDSMGSTRFLEYLVKMQSACTNEELRPKDTFNNDCMGMSGTFRSLCLD